MGLLGRYIDSLPAPARDRIIEAQDWCIAEVVGDDGRRCLVGHAEGWARLEVGPTAWRRWVDGLVDDDGAPDPIAASDIEMACRPELFEFRRAQPLDLDLYRDRVSQLGLEGESRIGSHFDRLWIRRGGAAAVAMVKRRAAADHGRPRAADRPAPSPEGLSV